MNTIKIMPVGPIKTKPLSKRPDLLIHSFGKELNPFGQYIHRFVLFKTDLSRKRTMMNCYPELIYRDNKDNVPSLFISKILSFPQNIGLGTKMLDFAQKFSKEIGCNGYFHLMADDCYTPNRVPHIFYWKYGMNTPNKEVNDKLDYFARNNKQARYIDFNNMEMFYPPIEKPEYRWSRVFKNFFG